MEKRPFFILALFLFLALIGGSLGFFYTQKSTIASFGDDDDPDRQEKGRSQIATPSSTAPEPPQDIVREVPIKAGETYTALMQKAGVSRQKALAILGAAQPSYDLARIKAGKNIELTFSPEKELKKLLYRIDTQEQLVATTAPAKKEASSSPEWTAKTEPIPYKVETAVASGTVTSSMYRAAQNKNIDIRAIIKLANAFQWTIDFAMETRKGDSFKFIYEKKYLDGEYVRPGKILAAKYINAGKEYQIYYYEESDDNQGYFNEEGKSAQKMFLKAPVNYKYISSGYTTGPRYLAKFRMYTSSHKAIDYAAKTGTPIRSVGNGVVTTAGWNSSGYGYLTAVRHNSTYTTRYAHQSRILVRPGQRVEQGEVIGYVGNTGLSTGPHLHYEMIKYGRKINPLNLELPPAKSISEESMDKFQKAIAPYQKMLNE